MNDLAGFRSLVAYLVACAGAGVLGGHTHWSVSALAWGALTMFWMKP